MKRLLFSICIFVLWSILLYFSICFISLKIDFRLWGELDRLLFGLLCCPIGLVISIAYYYGGYK